MASEISKASETLNKRMMTKVEWDSNSSPATSSEQIRVELLRKILSLRVFSHEVENLSEWTTQAISGQASQAAREKEVLRGRLDEIKHTMRGLRRYVKDVESFIQ